MAAYVVEDVESAWVEAVACGNCVGCIGSESHRDG